MVCTVGICLALLGTLVLYYAQLDALGGEKALSWLYLHEHANSLNPAMTKLALLFIVIGYGTKAGMAPMAAWMAMSNCWRGISSLSFSHILRPKS